VWPDIAKTTAIDPHIGGVVFALLRMIVLLKQM